VRSVTNGDGRLVMRVVVTRLLGVGLSAAVLGSLLISLAAGFDWRSVAFGFSIAGLAVVITAFTLRASLGTSWSNGRRFGDVDALRRLRRAVRRGSVDGLTEDDRRVAAEYARASRDSIVVDAVQNAGLGLSIGMNQVARTLEGTGVESFTIVLFVVAVGLVVVAVVTALVQDRRRRRFLAVLDTADVARRQPAA
jgi:predicted lipid-binding transport protein (Tim44 family)